MGGWVGGQNQLFWYNHTQMQKATPNPFRTEGTLMHGAFLRMHGSRIGHRFFSMVPKPFKDPVWVKMGDDVTLDLDTQIRNHSFEDMALKWGPNYYGSGMTLLQGACIHMSDTAEGVRLGRGALTWKC